MGPLPKLVPCLTFLVVTQFPLLGATPEYVSEVPNAGYVTLELHAMYNGQQSAELKWLGIDLRCSWEKSGEQLRVFRLGNYGSKKPPELALVFETQPDGNLHLKEGGLITAARLPDFPCKTWLVASTKPPGDVSLSYRARNSNQLLRPKYFDHGNLKNLPAPLPQSFVDVIALLFRDRSQELPGILKSPAISADVLDVILATLLDGEAGGGSDFILPFLGAHPHLSAQAQERLFNLPKKAPAWRAVAMNPASGKKYYNEYLKRIREGDMSIRFDVVRDTLAPREAWEIALAPKEPEVLGEFSRNKNAPPDLLSKVASEPGLRDLTSLASNPATPPAILDKLSNSTDKQVLWGVQRNPSSPPAAVQRVLRTMATSPSENLRDTVASDPRLPADLILKLSQDVSIQVRLVLAMNPSDSLEILEQLAADPYAMVSERARDNMKRRFPQEYASRSASWKALKELNPNNNLVQDVTDAIKVGDIAKARQLLAVTNDPEIRPSNASVAVIILRENFAGGQELLKELAQKDGKAVSEAIALSPDLKPEHLPWLVQNNILPRDSLQHFVVVATEHGREDLLKTARDNHFLDGIPQKMKNAALLSATGLRHSSLVDFWLKEGAEADQVVWQNVSALDVAAQMYSINLVKRLDAHGKYASLVQATEAQFPPAPQSRFLGSWSNKKDGFSTVAFMLGPDGTGYMGASIMSFPILWAPIDDESFRVAIVGLKGELMADKQIRFFYNQTRDTLCAESFDPEDKIAPNDDAGPFYRMAQKDGK